MEYETYHYGVRGWIITVLLTVLVIKGGFPQSNLVPNPSFEEYDFCSSFSEGAAWASDWMVPFSGLDPDYYNSCSMVLGLSVPDNSLGYQFARTGDAYVGIFSYQSTIAEVKDFVSIQLFDTLSAGTKYVFSSYFSLADDVMYSVDALGYLVSDSLPLSTPMIELNPTFSNEDAGLLNDKENWVRLTDTLIAEGGEKYLTIGCFQPDSLTDTVFVGNGNPNRNSAYHYLDDVSLIPLDSLLSVGGMEPIEVDVYPNPSSDDVTVRTKELLKGAWLTDLSGRRLWALDRRNATLWETDLSPVPRGVYLIEAITEDGRRAVRKVVKM